MTTQSVVTIALVSLCAFWAVREVGLRRHGSVALVAACCLVVLGGGLALWLSPAWAGWLTAILFVFALGWPMAFGSRALLAEGRGEWDQAARHLKWATIFYRTARARVHLEVLQISQMHDAGETGAALARIEALGSPIAKNNAYLNLAFAQRDWPSVLAFAQAEGLSGHPYGMDIRALGELGLVEEMVQAYQKAERDFRFEQPHLMLNVLAFTGQIEHVEKLLNFAFRKIDEDDKSYWTAVACLRRNPNDLAARGRLATLQETTSRQGRRRAAAAHLQNLANRMNPPPPLTSHSQGVVSGIIEKVSQAQRRRARQRRRWKAHWRGVLWLFLICIAITLLDSNWSIFGKR